MKITRLRYGARFTKKIVCTIEERHTSIGWSKANGVERFTVSYSSDMSKDSAVFTVALTRAEVERLSAMAKEKQENESNA